MRFLVAVVSKYRRGPDRIVLETDLPGINDSHLKLVTHAEHGDGKRYAREVLQAERVDFDLAPKQRRPEEEPMHVELRCKDYFEAAHHLPSMPVGHKCRNRHGHRWDVEIAVAGEPNPHTGILIDYYDLQGALRVALAKIDHRDLNETIPEAGEPTTEHLCRWLWMQLHRQGLSMLSEVRLQESPDFCCVFRG